MEQEGLSSQSISEIAQQLAALAATLRKLAEAPVFDDAFADHAEPGSMNSINQAKR